MCHRMSKASTTAATDARNRVVRRLAGTMAASVAVQAATILVLAWAYRSAAQFALDALASANRGKPADGADAIAAAMVVALELFTALAVGFFAARGLLRAIVRATPHPMKPPTRPIPWASLCAGGIVAAVDILTFASNAHNSGAPLWFGWTFELLRDAAIVALLWIAALRAVERKTA